MSELAIGTVMKDKSVYAGISPKTGNRMFVRPGDAYMIMTLDQAQVYVESLNRSKADGHADWRLPTKKELDVIFSNKDKGALKKTFNEVGADYGSLRNKREAPGWYRTSEWGSAVTQWCQQFKTGDQAVMFSFEHTSVRFVREEEPPRVTEPAPPPYATPDIVSKQQSRLKELARQHPLKLKAA